MKLTEEQKLKLLRLAYFAMHNTEKNKPKLLKYIKNNNLSAIEVYNFGSSVYNANLANKEDLSRIGEALADHVREYKEAEEIENNAVESKARDMYRGGRIIDSTARKTKVSLGKKSKKNNKSKKNKSRRIRY
jgi:hypothetical protein